jgi:hypothetical protein
MIKATRAARVNKIPTIKTQAVKLGLFFLTVLLLSIEVVYLYATIINIREYEVLLLTQKNDLMMICHYWKQLTE